MSSLLAKLTGSGNNQTDNNSNSSSSASSGSHSSTTSSSMASQSSAMHGSTTSGPYASGAAGANKPNQVNTTNPALSTAPGATTTQHTTGTTTTNNNNRSGYNANTGNTGYGNTGYGNTGYNTNTTGRTGVATAGMNDNTDNAMTRSEEQLRVGKEQMGAGNARLDKYVTTEHVQTAVPVNKERVVIEREPVTESNRGAAMSGPEISEAHHEVNLTEERAMAQKEVVPIERIRLGKQVETNEQMVGADLRKEHVDLTTTGINDKFDNVGYGRTTGTTDKTADNYNTANTNKNTTNTTKNTSNAGKV